MAIEDAAAVGLHSLLQLPSDAPHPTFQLDDASPGQIQGGGAVDRDRPLGHRLGGDQQLRVGEGAQGRR